MTATTTMTTTMPASASSRWGEPSPRAPSSGLPPPLPPPPPSSSFPTSMPIWPHRSKPGRSLQDRPPRWPGSIASSLGESYGSWPRGTGWGASRPIVMIPSPSRAVRSSSHPAECPFLVPGEPGGPSTPRYGGDGSRTTRTDPTGLRLLLRLRLRRGGWPMPMPMPMPVPVPVPVPVPGEEVEP